MEDSKLIYTASFRSSNSLQMLYVKTEWSADGFKLSVLGNKSAWFASVANDNLKRLAKKHEIKEHTYISTLRQYLSNALQETNVDILKNQFIIYQNVSHEKYKIKYFMIDVEQADFNKIYEDFLNDLLAENKLLREKVELLQKEKLHAESGKLVCTQKLESFVEIKRKIDMQMHSSFLLLLNRKKERIRHLNELLNINKNNRITNKSSSISLSKSILTHHNPFPIKEVSEVTSCKSDNYNTKETQKDNNLEYLGSNSPPLTVNIPKKRIKIQPSVSPHGYDCKNSEIQNNDLSENNSPGKQLQHSANEDSDSSFNTEELLDRL